MRPRIGDRECVDSFCPRCTSHQTVALQWRPLFGATWIVFVVPRRVSRVPHTRTLAGYVLHVLRTQWGFASGVLRGNVKRGGDLRPCQEAPDSRVVTLLSAAYRSVCEAQANCGLDTLSTRDYGDLRIWQVFANDSERLIGGSRLGMLNHSPCLRLDCALTRDAWRTKHTGT